MLNGKNGETLADGLLALMLVFMVIAVGLVALIGLLDLVGLVHLHPRF